MSTDIVTVQLTREDEKEKWGFQISGGKDQNSPLVISEVRLNYSRSKVVREIFPFIYMINSLNKLHEISTITLNRLPQDQLRKELAFVYGIWSLKLIMNQHVTSPTKMQKVQSIRGPTISLL